MRPASGIGLTCYPSILLSRYRWKIFDLPQSNLLGDDLSALVPADYDNAIAIVPLDVCQTMTCTGRLLSVAGKYRVRWDGQSAEYIHWSYLEVECACEIPNEGVGGRSSESHV